MRARLKALGREARRLGLRKALPGEIPRDDVSLDRLAMRLWELHARHDIPDAMALLFDLTAPLVAEKVKGALHGMIAAPEPEDLLAQTYFRLASLPSLPDRRGPRPFGRLIEELVQQTAQDILASRHRHTNHQDPIASLLEAAGPGPQRSGPPLGLNPSEMDAIVERNFATLPELTQQCFYLHLVEGKSLPDIAGELGLSLPAVAKRMNEARRRAFDAASEYRENTRSTEDEQGDGSEDDELEGGAS